MKNEAMSTSLQVAILDHGGNKPGRVECTLGAATRSRVVIKMRCRHNARRGRQAAQPGICRRRDETPTPCRRRLGATEERAVLALGDGGQRLAFQPARGRIHFAGADFQLLGGPQQIGRIQGRDAHTMFG